MKAELRTMRARRAAGRAPESAENNSLTCSMPRHAASGPRRATRLSVTLKCGAHLRGARRRHGVRAEEGARAHGPRPRQQGGLRILLQERRAWPASCRPLLFHANGRRAGDGGRALRGLELVHRRVRRPPGAASRAHLEYCLPPHRPHAHSQAGAPFLTRLPCPPLTRVRWRRRATARSARRWCSALVR